MLQQSLAVFLVLALLLAALWLLKRQGLASYGFKAGGSSGRGGRNADRQLRVIERLALTPQHTLHLVSMRDYTVLLATSPAGCQRVDSLPLEAAGEEPGAPLKNGANC